MMEEVGFVFVKISQLICPNCKFVFVSIAKHICQEITGMIGEILLPYAMIITTSSVQLITIKNVKKKHMRS